MQESTNAQIRYVHGNRLERLAERLAADIASDPIADPLVPELIVVSHPGMGRWLQRELARRWGIAMRLELPLPGRLVWDLATELTGIDEADASLEAGPLAFRILALLQGWAHVGWRGAPRSLPRPQDSIARWALAEHLGGLFDQYQVYRPDWVRAWDQGAVPRGMPQQGAWQGELWRALRRGSGAPHRAEVLDRATEILSVPSEATRTSLPARVSIFGVGTLPEPYLLFFAQLAHRTQVNWYHPDPGAAYWGDIVSERERARALARLQRLGGRPIDTHHDVAHPLLASLGAIGRDFVRALHGQGIATIADEDEFDLPASDTLLGWLQAGIVLLDPGHEAPPVLAKGAQGAAGYSGTRNLRVHSCPNRLREVEVLHDVLLGLFDELDGLRPDDIVVMSPRPADYAPLVRAVFDAAPPQRRVPYTISDRPVAAMHPLPALFLELLNLPDERFTASRVLGWLATPAISRRLGLDADALEWLSALVGEAGIRWGLDGASRAAAGSTSSPLYSWRFGLNRLLLGYACGATGQLVEGVAPYPGIEGDAALAVGALSTFVERLATWSERLRSPRTASGWRTILTAMLEVMFEREQADEGEAQGYAAITAALEAWEAEALAGKADALELEPDVMRAALAARFERPSPSQVFPGHGVTVCAMVPMRNLPFRVVCLLGLDSGEFPRVPATTGLDLMTQSPRPGDRSLAADDRYLFLEALMSAREHLHLSYVGREGRDLAKRPPGAALAELIDFIAAAYPDLKPDAAFDALVFEHRLHPYARDYFLPDAAFHSHAGEWIAPWIPPPEPTRADEGEARLEFDLVELARYARDPQRYFAERVLRLALPGDSVVEDEEPIEVSALDAYYLREHALAMYARDLVPVAGGMLPRIRAEAFLPIGVAGETAWAEAVALAGSIELTRTSQIDTGHELPDLEIDVRIGEFRLSGHITDLTTAGLIRTRAGQLRGGDWLRLALEARLAYVHGGAPAQAWGIDVVERKVRISRLDSSALDEAWALAVLQALQASQSARPPLLRHASWAYAKAYRKGREAALREAEAAFRGNEHAPGDFKDEATRLLWGDALVMDEAFEQAAIGLLVPVANAITVEP